MSVIGIELRADRAIGIVRQRGRAGATVEVPFDPAQPEVAVSALRAALGRASAIHLTIGLAHLDVAPVQVPAVDRATARAIVTTNADRFFLLGEPSAVAVDARGQLGFATSALALGRWVDAFERWAPVRAIEGAPESLLRALRAHDVRDAHLVLAAAERERGVIDIANGELTQVRRVPQVRGAAEWNGAQPISATQARAIPPESLVAWGATAANPSDDSAMLLSPSLAQRLVARRWWRSVQLSALALVALIAAAASLAGWRERTLHALDARVAALTPEVAGPLAEREALARAAAEAAELATANGIEPLAVLARLGERLPVDAVLQRVQFDGEGWQLIGTTRNTEAVVRRLAADSLFTDVRIAGPTTRFRDGGVMVESFTLAFRVRGPGAMP